MCVTPSPESTTTPVVRPDGRRVKSLESVIGELRRTLRIERQHGLDGNIDPLEPILLKHNLAHALSVHLWIHGWFGEKDLSASGIDFELFVKGVVPEMLHVLPVAYDTVLHWLGYLKVVSIGCGLVADHDILDHCGADALFSAQYGATDDGREY